MPTVNPPRTDSESPRLLPREQNQPPTADGRGVRWHKVVSLYQTLSHLSPGDPDYVRLRRAETEGWVLHALLAEGWVIESVTAVTGGPAFAHLIKDVSASDVPTHNQPAPDPASPVEPAPLSGPSVRSPLGLRQLRVP